LINDGFLRDFVVDNVLADFFLVSLVEYETGSLSKEGDVHFELRYLENKQCFRCRRYTVEKENLLNLCNRCSLCIKKK